MMLPSKPKIIKESDASGVYEIDGLYPGYGHTLGNSLRRIILSSLPGAAITSVKIDGVSHEFSVMDGLKEDVIALLLNLKKVRFKISGDDSQLVTLKIKGAKTVTAKDIKTPGQVEVLNGDQYLCETTGKSATLDIEITIQKGLGYVAKEVHQKEKVDIGTIALDAIYTPIRRVNYEVENMRVGDRTDHNRLRISIETDGTITPRLALEKSIETMIHQLKAIIGFKEPEAVMDASEHDSQKGGAGKYDTEEDTQKIKLESLGLSTRTLNALSGEGIRTLGGMARKKREDLAEIEGLGEKGVQEIKRVLGNYGITLK
ncbi:MAG: DNA-directed RNA polymerase subunit alpha [Candidatus Lloydbacteria bacterium RIFCSPHIGHO2_01_FULL_41_20]|uniref:DNA-directed RNA polymerase subunit alpha n=1 Tax=Candidatus Lloydbacteria bacterium RIFCSPHIGHO2_01_FULL_41_20 TaxID=1798657 RepID=A0A1G2CR38_9BACT|nr:MAG: DNA-directed RNA polymerase subunit alpha [Candidatus Lloydbacteria bacterium RIFCSPHIGHO2_01_FULL_41_20]